MYWRKHIYNPQSGGRYEMKAIKQLAGISITLFLSLLCVAAWAEMPAKYNLDNQLEKASEISKYTFMRW
jgi:hypothetical protein